MVIIEWGRVGEVERGYTAGVGIWDTCLSLVLLLIGSVASSVMNDLRVYDKSPLNGH
jgi:hypothetical protein